ncbi:PREDICTED: protein-cysteine N-palmitoyltransferase Rasp [Nicrophorus vespilloides]|uniref:Protein-cysteine N-palmitoyltransferase Rasp n=1 Tax=Nicrophorus vespilloides TaxID=110193 RepID=A0ABM1MTE6_NICVS|nr:PREDICTED: protein-cysteine N-palmitoyltransferase Rasp [Nicrophorus vespilloides]
MAIIKKVQRLPNVYETGIYFVIWISAVLYSIYNFYLATEDYFKHYEDVYGDFKNGWTVINRRRDVSDVEWETICQLLKELFPWLIVHSAMTEYLKREKIKHIVQLVLSFMFLLYYTNVAVFLLLVLQPFVFQLFSKFKNITLIWICCGLCLLIITIYKFVDNKTLQYVGITEELHITSIIAVFWINLRCLSFYIDKIKMEVNDKITFFDFINFVFYLPTLFCGPFVGYNDFKSKNNFRNLTSRTTKLFLNLLRVLFWFIFTEYCLHYIYINAISYQVEHIKTFQPWAIYGYGYAMGQFFHLKYVILYGLSTSFAEFEGVTVPHLPKCIGRIHLYSDMWKYFDVGLYKFLVKYIYIPTQYSQSYINKLFSSGLCFTFVYVWHGTQNYILIWTVLNFMGISVEMICKELYKKCFFNFGSKHPNMERRLTSSLASILLAISAISNFYFFAGTSIGNIFFEKLFTGNFSENFILLFCLYCCCQVSIQVKEWGMRCRALYK